MSVGTQSRTSAQPPKDSTVVPAVSVCESRPGTAVFIEADNTDGWIASDTTLEVGR